MLHQPFRLLTMILVPVILLSACNSSPQSIVGKWEQTSGDGIGSIYEFFKDGTVSEGGMAGTYSWPDSTHLKIEMLGIQVYEATLTGDELTLKESDQNMIVLKRYREFAPTSQGIAGSWGLNSPDESECFKVFGLDSSPSQIEFDSNGAVKIENYPSTSLGFFSISTGERDLAVSGQFSFSGNQIKISAHGTKVSSSSLGEQQMQQISGEVICNVTLSNARLTFTDNQGKTTLYTRKE